VLELTWLNSHFETGLRSPMDEAILRHEHPVVADYRRVDEIPFDFSRRVMSVVVKTPQGEHRLISKGAPEAIFQRCSRFELDGKLYPVDPLLIRDLEEEYDNLSEDGFRVLAIAYADLEPRSTYSRADESDLVLKGYVAFLDPPKETAAPAIAALKQHGVAVKILTGDNDLVSRKICSEVGIPTDNVLLGTQVAAMSDADLAAAADSVTLFTHSLAAGGDDWLLRNNLGLALAARGDREGALREYERASRLAPDALFPLVNRGVALAQLGRLPEARAVFLEARRRRPDSAEVLVNLGIAAEGLGRRDEAAGWYREALRADPANAQARRNLERLSR
jgi:tetratricopeptide (TPR) repeat protein